MKKETKLDYLGFNTQNKLELKHYQIKEVIPQEHGLPVHRCYKCKHNRQMNVYLAKVKGGEAFFPVLVLICPVTDILYWMPLGTTPIRIAIKQMPACQDNFEEKEDEEQ